MYCLLHNCSSSENSSTSTNVKQKQKCVKSPATPCTGSMQPFTSRFWFPVHSMQLAHRAFLLASRESSHTVPATSACSSFYAQREKSLHDVLTTTPPQDTEPPRCCGCAHAAGLHGQCRGASTCSAERPVSERAQSTLQPGQE